MLLFLLGFICFPCLVVFIFWFVSAVTAQMNAELIAREEEEYQKQPRKCSNGCRRGMAYIPNGKGEMEYICVACHKVWQPGDNEKAWDGR